MRWAGFGFGFLPAAPRSGGAEGVGTGVLEMAIGADATVTLSSVTSSLAMTVLSSFAPLVSTLLTSTPSVDASTTAAAVAIAVAALLALSISGAKGFAVADRIWPVPNVGTDTGRSADAEGGTGVEEGVAVTVLSSDPVTATSPPTPPNTDPCLGDAAGMPQVLVLEAEVDLRKKGAALPKLLPLAAPGAIEPNVTAGVVDSGDRKEEDALERLPNAEGMIEEVEEGVELKGKETGTDCDCDSSSK